MRIFLALSLLLAVACTDSSADQDLGTSDAAVADLSARDLAPLTCTGAGGMCVALTPGPNVCPGGHLTAVYSCGPGVGTSCCIANANPDAGANACESQGGTCVPVVPDACANGHVADASTHGCGGGVGTECCLP